MGIESREAPRNELGRRESAPEDTAILGWLGLESKWWVLLGVGTGTFMASINSSIISTIAPVIMRWYGIDFASVEWIVMVYLVVMAGLLLTFGRLGDMVGHKRVYLVGYGVFTVGAVACGLAPTVEALLVVRAVQAVGAAMLVATAPALLTLAFPGRQRGQALGMFGTMTYLGLMTGPALGGYLTNEFGWQSVFLINVPVGVIGMTVAYAAIAPGQPSARGERFDPAGALTFLFGLSALLLALSHGQGWGWTSGLVLGLLAAAAVLLATFLHVERRVAHPMMDLSLFRTRLFSAATISALMNYICTYSVTFMTPFYLLQYRGFSPSDAGLLISSMALVMAVAAPMSGFLSDRIGSRLPATLGMAMVTAGMVWLSSVGPETGRETFVAMLMVIGAGAGMFVTPNSSAIMGAVPRHRGGVASAMLGGARVVGMVLGVALAGAAFSISLSAHGGAIGPSAGFLPAFRDAFLVLAVCGLVGTLTSLVRGGKP